ncbi:MAG: molybdopterin converting factor subunit 1 [bacterium]
MIKVLFFARLREELGVGEEQLELNEQLSDIKSLLILLRQRDESFATALGAEKRLMFSINQDLVDEAAHISDGDEVAIFPPVTGG